MKFSQPSGSGVNFSFFQKSDVDFDLFDSQYSLAEANFKFISGFYFDSNASKNIELEVFLMKCSQQLESGMLFFFRNLTWI